MSLELPFLLAHRGASRFAPENTLGAIRKAHELGAKWIEIDVMLSADGEVVVFHDETLERTTNGHGKLCEKTYQELRALDAGGWFAAAYKEERIPTLNEVLAVCSELGLGINIELKMLLGFEDELVVKTLAIVAAWSASIIPPLFSSFSLKATLALRHHDAECQLGLLLEEWVEGWEIMAAQLNCVSIHIDQACLTAARVAAIKASGRALLTYTVNNGDRARELQRWGVTSIFTDDLTLLT